MISVETTPNWAEIVTAVGTAVAAFGLVFAGVGTILAWSGIKENSKGRHAQIAIDLGRRWDDPALADVRQTTNGFSARRFQAMFEEVAATEEYAKFDAFASFFEDLGVLNKMGIIDITWVDETLGSAVLGYWCMYHLVALDSRRTPQLRKLWENWEALAFKIWQRRKDFL